MGRAEEICRTPTGTQYAHGAGEARHRESATKFFLVVEVVLGVPEFGILNLECQGWIVSSRDGLPPLPSVRPDVIQCLRKFGFNDRVDT